MSHEAHTFILRATNEEQAEYAAAALKNSPAADVEGAPASGAQTSAGATLGMPDREAGAHPFAPGNDDGEILGGTPRYPSSSPLGSASTPTWAPIDSDTGDLLDLLANEHPAIPIEVEQWNHFRAVLRRVASANGGLIDQNQTRPLLRGAITSRRIGPFWRRACLEGLIRAEGWTTSDDREGKNSGRPCRSYRWLDA